MSLILCGDPKQDQQENSFLKTIIYFGMHLINMTTTKLQNKHRERLFISHQNHPCNDFEHDPQQKILQWIKIKMNLPHTQSSNHPSILQHLRNLPKSSFPVNSGESSLKLQRRW